MLEDEDWWGYQNIFKILTKKFLLVPMLLGYSDYNITKLGGVGAVGLESMCQVSARSDNGVNYPSKVSNYSFIRTEQTHESNIIINNNNNIFFI